MRDIADLEPSDESKHMFSIHLASLLDYGTSYALKWTTSYAKSVPPGFSYWLTSMKFQPMYSYQSEYIPHNSYSRSKVRRMKNGRSKTLQFLAVKLADYGNMQCEKVKVGIGISIPIPPILVEYDKPIFGAKMEYETLFLTPIRCTQTEH
jgi:hypothetical protein